ncbi:hypothetical protein L1286_00390 [Pseudoalteromonas sp. SMS1]|uniref:HEPN domain-containing protein n=1 Tax=Pseudoalteromonas sp. SMS1 TaxID=2908894 RepID=UPI001F3B269C|nr:HEPN domain-containing protein [Pseudoalteromonas sp. SMS1]MCF2855913.1 hypothetical protein [Pseudoalteromonas sp. SMS1]
MKEFKVEYLILMEDDGGFCNCKNTFNKLLQAHSDIKISNKKLTYKEKFEVEYNLLSGEVENKKQRFFQLTLNAKCEADKLDIFVQLLRDINTIIPKSGGKQETLVNDISTFYSLESYPLIHRIENTMRRLITTFMLRKIGTSWLKDSSPKEFKVAVEKSKRKDAPQVYKVDFIHLADFLFKPYSIHDTKSLIDKLDSAKSIESLNLEQLKSYVPKSNWQRYFSEIVDCEDTFIKSRWEKLYDLRCLIAHNAIVTKQDYEKIKLLVDEVSNRLVKAIQEIDKISVPADDKESVAESVVSNMNSLYGEFITSWKKLNSMIFSLSKEFDMHVGERQSPDGSSHRVRLPEHVIFRNLAQSSIITQELTDKLSSLQRFRNVLVHSNEPLSNQDIEENIRLISECILNVENAFEKAFANHVIVDLDDDVPESMRGIIRAGRVVFVKNFDEQDEEQKEREDLVDNREFHNKRELVKYISNMTGVPFDNIDIRS